MSNPRNYRRKEEDIDNHSEDAKDYLRYDNEIVARRPEKCSTALALQITFHGFRKFNTLKRKDEPEE